MEPVRAFLSYASEDHEEAKRLYRELSAGEPSILVWFDREALQGGVDWKREIGHAIRETQVFMLLLSRSTTTKRGYVQREIREALEVLKLLPEGSTFVVPLRIEPCTAHFEFLRDLQCIDLFPDWDEGVRRLRDTLANHFGYVSESAIRTRVRSRVAAAIAAADLGPYSFVRNVTVSRRFDRGSESVRLDGGLFTWTEAQRDFLFQMVVASGDGIGDFGRAARSAMALRDAIDWHGLQTSNEVRGHHLVVVPNEVSTRSVQRLLDPGALALKILEHRGASSAVTTEDGLDRRLLDFLY